MNAEREKQILDAVFTPLDQSPAEMKGLSLWEPWATAMRIGMKKNGTRGHRTHYRGDLVICSAKRPLDSNGFQVLFEIESLCLVQGKEKPLPVFGCALCVVEIFDCVETDGGVPDIESFAELFLGNYTPGRFAWRSRNLRPLAQPVPITGRQGLFTLTTAEAESVRKQLPHS